MPALRMASRRCLAISGNLHIGVFLQQAKKHALLLFVQLAVRNAFVFQNARLARIGGDDVARSRLAHDRVLALLGIERFYERAAQIFFGGENARSLSARRNGLRRGCCPKTAGCWR